jgi:WD40 repeat protein
VRVLNAAEGAVCDLAFSPDGRAVAAAIEGYGIFLWNLEAATTAYVRLPAGDEFSKGTGLGFSTDGRSVAWRTLGSRRVYNRDTREATDHSFAVTESTHGFTASGDGARIISEHGLPNHCLIGWMAAGSDWRRAWTLSTAGFGVQSLTLSPDGQRFAMLAQEALGSRWWEKPRHVEVRDTASSALRAVGEYPYNIAAPLLFSPDARQLVGFRDMTLLAWSVPENGPLGSPRLIRNDSRKHFTAMAYHPVGRHLYATSNDTTVHVFDTATWQRATRFTWKIGKLKAVAVSPDGALAAAGGDRGEIVIWDVDV